MSESIVTGVFTLLGVIIGVLIDFILDSQRMKKEVKTLTIIEYEKLCEEIRKYIAGFISQEDLKDYYYEKHRDKIPELKAKQQIYLSRKQKKTVRDMEVYSWQLLEEGETHKLFDKLQKDINRL